MTSRPWAIRRWCLYLSISTAVLAEVGFIFAWIIAGSSGNHNFRMLVMPLLWPVFYGIILLLACGIAMVDQRGPAFANFPKWYQALFPDFIKPFFNWVYPVMPNVALVLFPTSMLFPSALFVWVAATGQLNP